MPDWFQGRIALRGPAARRGERPFLLVYDNVPSPELLDGLVPPRGAAVLVTSRALWLRRDHPDWFTGGYTPLACEGPAAGHAVAFMRGEHAVTVATRLPAGLRRKGGWADTVLPLGEVHWRDVLTGARHAGLCPLLSELTRRLPVALLIPERVFLSEAEGLTDGSPR